MSAILPSDPQSIENERLRAFARWIFAPDFEEQLDMDDEDNGLTVFDDPELVELVAEQSHKSWSGWARWMAEKWHETHGGGEPFQARWQRQCNTPYAELSETEKESDRIEARALLAVISRFMGTGDE